MENNLTALQLKYENAKAFLLKQIAEITEIIVNDIPKFGLRVAREAFVEDVNFAEALSDAELAAFKTRLNNALKELAAKMSAELNSNEDNWLNVPDDVTGGKTLEGNAEIWKHLQNISEGIKEILDKEGLRANVPAYKTPSCFIDGKYPPGIIEKYWAQLNTVKGIKEEINAIDLENRKASQASRWDNF